MDLGPSSLTTVGDWGPASLDDPRSYPGPRPARSFLLFGDRVLPLEPQLGRRLGYARVTLAQDHELHYLDRFLLRGGEAAMGGRVPVLGFGSNASPAQLHRKLCDGGVPPVVPVTRVTVGGVTPGFAAAVSHYGCIPGALARSGGSSDLWVTWLDPEQLALMHRTEPGYEFAVLDGRAAPTRVHGSEELLTGVGFYRWCGSLLDVGEAEASMSFVELAWSGERSPPPTRTLDQGSLWERIGRDLDRPELGRAGGPAEAMGLIDDRGVRRWMEAHDLDDGLDDLVDVAPAHAYDGSYGGWDVVREHVGSASTFVAMESTRLADEHGRPDHTFCVFGSHATVRAVGAPWVVVRRATQGPDHLRPCAFGRLLASDEVPDGHLGVDITLRFAIGVTTGDLVTIDEIEVPPPSFARRVLPTRTTYARVVTSDASIAEMRSCYLSSGLMRFLGVSDGDRIVLSHPSEGRVRRVKVRSFEIPATLAATRAGAERSRVWAKYPCCGDLLGVESDFGQIYLDAEDRRRLGVDRCGAVQVTADWRDQVSDAGRDIGLLVVIAALGLATMAQGSTLSVAGLRVSLALVVVLGLVLCALALVLWSVRRRLG